jgi:photosystem I P700 chlorophyll a apoprotein A1
MVRFSNYEAWLTDPTHIKPSAQIVCCSSQVLNGEVVVSVFKLLQVSSNYGVVQESQELQLYTTAIGGLILAGAMFFWLVPLPQSSS